MIILILVFNYYFLKLSFDLNKKVTVRFYDLLYLKLDTLQGLAFVHVGVSKTII